MNDLFYWLVSVVLAVVFGMTSSDLSSGCSLVSAVITTRAPWRALAALVCAWRYVKSPDSSFTRPGGLADAGT